MQRMILAGGTSLGKAVNCTPWLERAFPLPPASTSPSRNLLHRKQSKARMWPLRLTSALFSVAKSNMLPRISHAPMHRNMHERYNCKRSRRPPCF